MGTALVVLLPLVVADAGRYGAPRACPVPGSSLLPDSASLSVAHGRQNLLVKLLVQPNHPKSFGKPVALLGPFTGPKARSLWIKGKDRDNACHSFAPKKSSTLVALHTVNIYVLEEKMNLILTSSNKMLILQRSYCSIFMY
jgi:hypothetical protein